MLNKIAQEGGGPLTYVEFDGDSYEIGTDENGSPNQLKRYNEEHEVHISLHFSNTENPALIDEIKDALKDIYIANIMSLTDKE